MTSRSGLATRLSAVEGFAAPSAELEQYLTPARLAATVVHVALLRGDIDGRTVVDLGTGTGMLALAAATRGPERVVGIEVDRDALVRARANERRVDPSTPVTWVHGDATRPSLGSSTGTTVVSNPPFGAQNEHADRAFLRAAARTAAVSYTVHNAGSRRFVESFVADEGGELTDAYASEIGIDRQFDFHRADRRTVEVEVYRVAWRRG